MYKKILLVIFCICSLFFAVSCGNGEPVPGDEGTITIEVVNNTEDIIVSHALFYGENLDEWGEDLLNEEIIAPGEIFNFVLPVGTYSLVLMTYEYYIIPGGRNINSDTSFEIGGNGLVPILVRNGTENDIAFFYIDPVGSEVFGEDRLGDEVLPAGLGRFFFIEPGVYDFFGLDYEGKVVLMDTEITITGKETITVE